MPLRFLIIQTAFIGDAILTLPLLQKLKEKYSDAKIDVVAIQKTEEIFLASPAVHNVFVLSKRSKHKSIFGTIKFALNLRKINYDKIVSPHRSLRSSLLVFFASGKETIGFSSSVFKFVYKTKVEYCKGCHEVERNLKLIGEDTSNGKWKILPELLIDDNGKKKINKLLSEVKSKKIAVIAPGSVWETKKYPSEYFVRVIQLLNEQGIYFVLIGSEADKNLCDQISTLAGTSCSSLAGHLSIPESVELLRRCKFLISNDSAPTHFGMVAGIPTATIFCSTVAEFGFYPYNYNSITLSYNNLKCKPCGIHGHKICPTGTFECGKKLLPQNIIKSIQTWID